ncbi:MAG: hypothetical protein ACR2K1_00130, partial [Saprospiraceae bacterium]
MRLFLCLFLSLPFSLAAQSATDSLAFPASWVGDWSGTLEIYTAKGLAQSVPMTVVIHPIDSSTEGRYTFGLIYGA